MYRILIYFSQSSVSNQFSTKPIQEVSGIRTLDRTPFQVDTVYFRFKRSSMHNLLLSNGLFLETLKQNESIHSGIVLSTSQWVQGGDILIHFGWNDVERFWGEWKEAMNSSQVPCFGWVFRLPLAYDSRLMWFIYQNPDVEAYGNIFLLLNKYMIARPHNRTHLFCWFANVACVFHSQFLIPKFSFSRGPFGVARRCSWKHHLLSSLLTRQLVHDWGLDGSWTRIN